MPNDNESLGFSNQPYRNHGDPVNPDQTHDDVGKNLRVMRSSPDLGEFSLLGRINVEKGHHGHSWKTRVAIKISIGLGWICFTGFD